MTYSDKLKDPRWQKKRLEILNRDDFTCQICGETEKTLHVHHKYYDKDKDPWDYSENKLETLCDACHKSTHEYLSYINRILSEIPCSFIGDYAELLQQSIFLDPMEVRAFVSCFKILTMSEIKHQKIIKKLYNNAV